MRCGVLGVGRWDKEVRMEGRCAGWLGGRRICVDRNCGVNGSRGFECYVRRWKMEESPKREITKREM